MKPQLSLLAQKHRDNHGGDLRKCRRGRGHRPLSTKHSHHVVFKINRVALKKGLRHPENFWIIQQIIRRYSRRFFVSVEQVTINHDHIHLLVRAGRRSQYQHFFRVTTGQIAQTLTDSQNETYSGPRIWKSRPFSRVVRGRRAIAIIRNYIQLNELEASGRRPYRPERLRGLKPEELAELWT